MKSSILFAVCLAVLVDYTTSQQVECPPDGTTQLSHPNCTLFVNCDNGIEVELECPDDLHYNPETTMCDSQENVPECIEGTRAPVFTTTQIITTSGPTEEPTTASPTETTSTAETSTVSTTMSTTTEETTTVLVPSSTTSSPPPSILTQCGQAIQAEFGAIEYKLDQTYNEHELCAFIIRPQNYSDVLFRLESHGISDSDPDAVTILSYRTWVLPINSHNMGPPSSEQQLSIPGSLFVVIFKSNSSSSGTGFKLSFEVTAVITHGLNGVDFVYNNETATSLEIPFWPEFIEETEDNLFVLTSGASLITGETSYLGLSASTIFDGCRFLVYQFEDKAAHLEGWVVANSTTYFETKGLFVVVFHKPENADGLCTGVLKWEKVAHAQEQPKSLEILVGYP